MRAARYHFTASQSQSDSIPERWYTSALIVMTVQIASLRGRTLKSRGVEDEQKCWSSEVADRGSSVCVRTFLIAQARFLHHAGPAERVLAPRHEEGFGISRSGYKSTGTGADFTFGVFVYLLGCSLFGVRCSSRGWGGGVVGWYWHPRSRCAAPLFKKAGGGKWRSLSPLSLCLYLFVSMSMSLYLYPSRALRLSFRLHAPPRTH